MITMQAALTIGRWPPALAHGTPDLALGDLEALVAFCAVQTRLHARAAKVDHAADLLEGGPGEDGADSLLMAAADRIRDARVIEESAEEMAA